MPSNKTRNTLARQWELLKLLPTRGSGKSAKEIADALADAGFVVSKRQVERDLIDLQEVFGLECNDASIPYGWRWGSSPVDLPGVNLAEALSLQIVEETLKPLLPASVLRTVQPRFDQAKNKLRALSEKTRALDWAEKVCSVAPTLPMIPAHVDESLLETVQTALLADEQITARYTPLTGELKSYRLHPLGLAVRGAVTYLVATVAEYPDIKLFAMHRFESVERLHESSKRPANFKLDQYVLDGGLHFGRGEQIKLVAYISSVLEKRLMETPIADDQEIAPSGNRFKLTATIAKTWQLEWWILSKGAEIEIVKPLTFRAHIRSVLKKTIDQYKAM